MEQKGNPTDREKAFAMFMEADLSPKNHEMLLEVICAAKLNSACEGKILDGKPAGLALLERYLDSADPHMLSAQEAAEAMQNIIEGHGCSAALTIEDLFALSDEGFFDVVDSTWKCIYEDTQRILDDIHQKMFADEDAGLLEKAV